MLAETEAYPATYEVEDAFAANELFQRNGWTDGLPIVPPTPELDAAFLERAGLEAEDVLGLEPVRRRRISAAKVAANAVMAGCLPDYVPVVVAAGRAPFTVVNGPIRAELGMSATHSVLASSNRANGTIGRAIRLILINVLGTIPGQMDRSTLGHPGKYTFCIAEDEEDSPWTPLPQERGIPAGVSGVTVMAGEAPRQVMNEWTRDPEE